MKCDYCINQAVIEEKTKQGLVKNYCESCYKEKIVNKFEPNAPAIVVSEIEKGKLMNKAGKTIQTPTNLNFKEENE